jgi:hypothetical protein
MIAITFNFAGFFTKSINADSPWRGEPLPGKIPVFLDIDYGTGKDESFNNPLVTYSALSYYISDYFRSLRK